MILWLGSVQPCKCMGDALIKGFFCLDTGAQTKYVLRVLIDTISSFLYASLSLKPNAVI